MPRAFARRTISSSARSIVREYVRSPLIRTASSSNCSSITTFVRFIHTSYHNDPSPRGRLSYRPLPGRALAVLRAFHHQFLHAPVQQLPHPDLVLRRTRDRMNPPDLAEVLA